jgi:hypothetical protein
MRSAGPGAFAEQVSGRNDAGTWNDEGAEATLLTNETDSVYKE